MDAEHVPVQLPVDDLEEVLDEDRDVFPPFPQRRDLERDDLEAVIEVLPESAAFHPLMEVAVGGCDETEVDRNL